MHTFRNVLILLISLFSCLGISGCRNYTLPIEPTITPFGSEWKNATLFSFSGYISAYENTEAYLQIPFYIDISEDISETDISILTLEGSDEVIQCSVRSLSNYSYKEEFSYKSAVLGFSFN